MTPTNESSAALPIQMVPLEAGSTIKDKLGLHELNQPRSGALELWVERLREYADLRGIGGQVMYQPGRTRESIPPFLVFRGGLKADDSLDEPVVLDDPLDLEWDKDDRCCSNGVIETDGTLYISAEHVDDQQSRMSQWGSPMESPPSGDLAESWFSSNILTVLLVDGLGHGTAAHEASKQARDATASVAFDRPDQIINHLHEAIAETRGGAVFVGQIDVEQSQLSYCSVGNIEARIVGPETSYLFADNGIVGYKMPDVETRSAAFSRENWLICHTDGVHCPGRDFYDDTFSRLSPALNSLRIHDRFEKGTDDAHVLVARY